MKNIKDIVLAHNKIKTLGGRYGWRVEDGMGEVRQPPPPCVRPKRNEVETRKEV